MRKITVLTTIVLISLGSTAHAGFKKGNGEVQFAGQEMPVPEDVSMPSDTKTHPSLTQKSDSHKSGDFDNAWAPHDRGALEGEFFEAEETDQESTSSVYLWLFPGKHPGGDDQEEQRPIVDLGNRGPDFNSCETDFQAGSQ